MSASAEKFRAKATRVLLAMGDKIEARRLLTLFEASGFEIQCVNTIAEAQKALVEWRPKVFVSNMMLSGGNALELLDFLQRQPQTPDPVSTIILSAHANPENMEEAFRKGAKDYLHRPFMHQELLNRVVLQCRDPLDIEENLSDINSSGVEALLTLAMSADKMDVVIHHITQATAKKLKGVRCSLIRTITTNEGMVIASNDDPNVGGLRLDLSQYPEVQLVSNTKKMIAINDLGSSRALKHILDKAKSVQFSAMIVAPVFYKNRFFGVLSLRLPQSSKKVQDADVHFMSIAAKVTSLAISSRSVEELGQFGLIQV